MNAAIIAAMIAASKWTFGVNDPSFIAWFIVAVYFVASLLCWRARGRELSEKVVETSVLWVALASALFVLGLNKQLDLHVLVMEFARDLRSSDGYSPAVRIIVLAVVVIVGLAALGLGGKYFFAGSRRVRCAYGILLGLLSLQVLRFLPGRISEFLLMHVLTEEGILHIHAIEVVELGGLLGIAWLASRNEPTALAADVAVKPEANDG